MSIETVLRMSVNGRRSAPWQMTVMANRRRQCQSLRVCIFWTMLKSPCPRLDAVFPSMAPFFATWPYPNQPTRETLENNWKIIWSSLSSATPRHQDIRFFWSGLVILNKDIFRRWEIGIIIYPSSSSHFCSLAFWCVDYSQSPVVSPQRQRQPSSVSTAILYLFVEQVLWFPFAYFAGGRRRSFFFWIKAPQSIDIFLDI